MLDGTWGWVYWGDKGVGIGVMVIKDGKLHGNDGGIAYSGIAVEDPITGRVKLEVDMRIPAGVALVGGAAALDVPHVRHISLDLPPRLGELTPVDISAVPGKTGAVFKQVPDDRARFAEGFTVVPKK